MKSFGEYGVKIEREKHIYLISDVADDPLEILIAKEEGLDPFSRV